MPKKPIALERLEGNPGKRPIPEEIEMVKEAEPPGPPAHLDDYAKEEWGRIAAGLHGVGLLSQADMGALTAYCMAYGTARAAQEELNKLSESKGILMAMLHVTKSGNVIQQPLQGIRNKAMADMVHYAAEFGMTPSARARLSLDLSPRKKSKFDGLIGHIKAKRVGNAGKSGKMDKDKNT
jgi:P27 family predicted phage terminase small subunit